MKYLFIAAHPDDEVLGCGATMARLAEEGHELFVQYLSDNTLRHGVKNALKKYADSSAQVLGVSEWWCAQIPDQGMWKYQGQVVSMVEAAVKRCSPDVVFTHSRKDLNNDHQLCHDATLIATRSHKSKADVVTYSVAGSSFGQEIATPRLYVPVTEGQIIKKIAALECFELESMEAPHPRSVEAVRAQAVVTGSQVMAAYAESFEIVRSIW